MGDDCVWTIPEVLGDWENYYQCGEPAVQDIDGMALCAAHGRALVELSAIPEEG